MAQLLPKTQTVSAFAYDVYANGIRIGNLQSFSPTSTRALLRIREIGSSRAGETIEIVPGTTDHSLTISVLELYATKLIAAFGYKSFASIEDLKDPFDINERITAPSGEVTTVRYLGCVLQNHTKSVNVGGTVVTENATIWVTQVRTL